MPQRRTPGSRHSGTRNPAWRPRSSKPFIGIDLGGTKIQAGVLNARNKIIGRGRSKTDSDKGPKAVLDRITKTVREACQDAGLSLKETGGVGIGAPGTIDLKTGVVVNATNLRWNDYPLARLIKERLGIPVTLDNDVNVGAWGEFVLGAGQGWNDLLAVFVGTGIGGGLVLGGKLYHGHYFTAGEIGHVTLHADGALGRRSLENCASRTAIVRLLADLIRSNHPSKLTRLTHDPLDAIRSKVIAKALHAGDNLTKEVLRQAAYYVGVTIANAVTLLSLPCVVVGGGLVQATGSDFVDWIRKGFEQHVFPPEMAKDCSISISSLGDDAGVIGAALLARERLG